MEHYSNPWELFWSQHDSLSARFSWHEQHLNERFLDLSGFIGSISNTLEEEDLDYSRHSYPSGFFEVEQPSRIRYIWIIFTYTIFERRTRSLCQMLRECDSSIAIELNDLNGSYLDKLKTFLLKGVRVDIQKSISWEKIRCLQKVRDCIVHCGGRVSESKDEKYLQTLLHQNIGLSLSPKGYLKLNDDFCNSLTEAVVLFISEWLNVAHTTMRKRISGNGN